MRRQLVPAIMMMVVFTVLCGIVYPLAVTGVSQLAFKDKANGSQLEVDGKVVGSELLGQTFTKAKYFHGRPSSAGAAASGSEASDDDGKPVPNDPKDLSQDISSGSNYGPTNPEFLDTIKERVAAYREENGLADDVEVPVDAVTASASGLDPDITVANARLQVARVAKARDLSTDEVSKLVDEHTTDPELGFLGEQRVNVLKLNVALDQLSRG
jgi:potassium-transporting ATPase KdpC subunit